MNRIMSDDSSELTSDPKVEKVAIFNESVETLNTDNLQAITLASSEPTLHKAEQEKLNAAKHGGQKMRAAKAFAASALLAGSLLLSACGDDQDDCIPSTPPAGTGSGASYVLPTPNPASLPTAPASSQFTSGQPAQATNQTYCRSRRTGGYYWYAGSYVSGGS